MALREGQPKFVGGIFVRLEQFELVDQAAEGARGDLLTAQQSLFDAPAVELGQKEDPFT
jgi:hypothetical protein